MEQQKKRRESGKLPAKKKLLFYEGALIVSSLGAFIAKSPLQNYKNNLANTITMGEKREENQKKQKA